MQRQGGGFWRRGSRRAGQEIIVPFGQKQPFLRRRRQRRVFAAHGLESAARKNPPFPCRHQKNLIFPQSLRHQPPPRKLGGPRWLRATAGGAALHSKGAPERMQRQGGGEDAAARAALQDKVARPVRPPQDLPSSDPLSLWQCLLPSRPPKPQEGRFCLRACCV